MEMAERLPAIDDKADEQGDYASILLGRNKGTGNLVYVGSASGIATRGRPGGLARRKQDRNVPLPKNPTYFDRAVRNKEKYRAVYVRLLTVPASELETDPNRMTSLQILFRLFEHVCHNWLVSWKAPRRRRRYRRWI